MDTSRTNHKDPTRTFAMVVGAVFLVAGVLGFIPGVVHPPEHTDPMRVTTGYGDLLGIFPVNVLHNIVHLVVGVAGLLAARTLPASVTFSRGLAVFYGLLAVMGLFPVLRTTFGLIPIFGHDVWLHALTAAPAAYFGWAVPHGERAAQRTPTPHHA